MKSALYYEAHVTIDPVFDERRVHAQAIATTYAFKLAKLIMRKKSTDPEQESQDDTFMTGHSQDFDNIRMRMEALIKHLQERGFFVRRYKIEDTLMDSRTEDVLGLFVRSCSPCTCDDCGPLPPWVAA